MVTLRFQYISRKDKVMGETKLTEKQLVLLKDIKEDMQLYKEEMESQIRAAKLNMGIGIGVAVVMGFFLLFKPEFMDGIMGQINNLTAKMGVIGTIVGEGLPVMFGLKSFNNSKEQKKRLKGVRVFEKDVSRMEEGIIPNGQDNILALEKEFSRYINT